MAHSSIMGKLGTKAPNFNLPNMNKSLNISTISLDFFKDYKLLLVVFICNHCPYVIHIIKSLVDFASDYEKNGLAIVSINSNDIKNYPQDNPSKMSEFAEKYSFPFPYLFDESQEIAKNYFAACTPDFFLYDQNRTLVYRGQYDSSRPNNSNKVTGKDLKIACQNIIENKNITEEQIPSVGCNVKWIIGNEPAYFK